MNNIVNISDFRNNISDYINRVIYNKDSFLLKKGKSIVAKVVVYKEQKELLIEDKIKKYAGIWSDKEANLIRKYARKLRKEVKLIPRKYDLSG
ncbi:MAG: hypothetical protein US48_C0025G0004 [Candidatus Levybacteria bacterium GW2011_GWA2_37_36]|uniref:Antitoxin n=1 Tax=Candidatus Roizmanbacteria bacterium GW2011_GWC2_34_23 TaxID=1618484 RepID=A0A0G0B0S1_9BACT|nr:MAG: hypothetical protein UR56_C0003G0031 [Candidatus Roizmanbacteria bacterium GW2011_GWC2_34_23]KKQ32396.1 MAG: hypothetical protein US48_C0025G0004 [Candidatus Levybacteria bacterium GW2011_GWA2_37_36]